MMSIAITFEAFRIMIDKKRFAIPSVYSNIELVSITSKKNSFTSHLIDIDRMTIVIRFNPNRITFFVNHSNFCPIGITFDKNSFTFGKNRFTFAAKAQQNGKY